MLLLPWRLFGSGGGSESTEDTLISVLGGDSSAGTEGAGVERLQPSQPASLPPPPWNTSQDAYSSLWS